MVINKMFPKNAIVKIVIWSLAQFNTLLHPVAKGCNFKDTTFPRTLWANKKVVFGKGDSYTF